MDADEIFCARLLLFCFKSARKRGFTFFNGGRGFRINTIFVSGAVNNSI